MAKFPVLAVFNRPTALFIAVVLLLASLVARAADEADLVIGSSAKLSGTGARTGQEQLRGLQLWVEEANARGGVLGRKLKLLHYDDGGDAAASARVHEKLIVEDKVAILIGPDSSDMTFAAAAVAEKHEVPMIAPGVVSKALWERGYKNVVGLTTPATASMDQVLEFARRKGLWRVAVIYQNTALPREMAEGAKAKAAALGLRMVLDEGYDKDTSDFTAIVGRLKTKRPDVLIIGSYLPDSIAFMRQLKENKLSARMIAFTAGPNLAEFGKQLGPDAEGAMGVTHWEPGLKAAGVTDFARRFKAKYGHDADYHAAGGYAAGQVLEAAMKRAASMEPEHLRKALFGLDTVTVLGRYKVSAAGQQTGKPGYLVQWVNGERAMVLPEETATAKIMYPLKGWSKR